MDIKEYMNSQHWLVRMGIGCLMLYGVIIIMKWTGLGVLTSIQMLAYTGVVAVLCLLAVGLLKDGAVDSFFAAVNSLFGFFKNSFAEALDKAKEDLRKDKEAS